MTIPTYAYFYLLGLLIAVLLFAFAYVTREDTHKIKPHGK